jgi:hypothetical protein
MNYRSATGPAAQAVVLDEFDDWFELSEKSAVELYEINRNCSKFLLKHLPFKFSFWGGEKRRPWRQLIGLARNANDDELAFALYRRQIDPTEWQRDIEQIARDFQDPDRLNDELRKRHLEGWGIKRGNAALALLKLRGRDVLPYLREKLETIVGGWDPQSSPGPLLKLCESHGWWDLWTAVVRTAADPKVFNRESSGLLADNNLDDATRKERLRALAGVSGEWNWSGVGFATVHSLEDDVATELYLRYPELVRGPFKLHVVPTWWQAGPKLLAVAIAAADDELVDVLASRYVTRGDTRYTLIGKEEHKIQQAITRLAETYQNLRDRNEIEFARRAANVLTQIPAFSIFGYDQLLRTNDLARLLFVRSFSAYLGSAEAVRDLIEGSEIHVQMLGYRVLGQDDERARRLAAKTIEILQGTLLRPLHRKTRLAAFSALLNAARYDLPTAQLVLKRSREAMRLPDKKYPKEELVGLMAHILHAQRPLRSPREQAVVYGLPEAVR